MAKQRRGRIGDGAQTIGDIGNAAIRFSKLAARKMANKMTKKKKKKGKRKQKGGNVFKFLGDTWEFHKYIEQEGIRTNREGSIQRKKREKGNRK